MTRMTRPDCAVMCNLINTHTHTKRILPRKIADDNTMTCNRKVQSTGYLAASTRIESCDFIVLIGDP